jgi:RNA polymerase sigma-70 factor (ECF subfamily)
MADPSPTTSEFERCLARLHEGDASAVDDLIAHAYRRLERLAHSRLRAFPGVRRWEDTGDVLHRAMERFPRALREVAPATVGEFFALAATHIRRQLIDLARHYGGAEGLGANHASSPANEGAEAQPYEPADETYEPGGLAEWREFHEQVEKLPEAERAVFDLLYYHGLPQLDAARLLGVTVKTVYNRWRSARLRLHAVLKGERPASEG